MVISSRKIYISIISRYFWGFPWMCTDEGVCVWKRRKRVEINMKTEHGSFSKRECAKKRVVLQVCRSPSIWKNHFSERLCTKPGASVWRLCGTIVKMNFFWNGKRVPTPDPQRCLGRQTLLERLFGASFGYSWNVIRRGFVLPRILEPPDLIQSWQNHEVNYSFIRSMKIRPFSLNNLLGPGVEVYT